MNLGDDILYYKNTYGTVESLVSAYVTKASWRTWWLGCWPTEPLGAGLKFVLMVVFDEDHVFYSQDVHVRSDKGHDAIGVARKLVSALSEKLLKDRGAWE